MANLKTDSRLSRRIVRAFLDFLDSVEPPPDVDVEGLEVARECLSQVFQLDSPPPLLPATPGDDEHLQPGLLVNLFRSLESVSAPSIPPVSAPAAAPSSHPQSSVSDPPFAAAAAAAAAPSSHPQSSASDPPFAAAAAAAADSDTEMSTEYPEGVSRDELCGQFFAALEKIHFFKTSNDGMDDPVQLEKATRLFHDALNEMEKAGCQTFDQSSLAETLKSQGNRAMQSKLYSDAIELYSCAVSLCENNAVYYCNRAAAYTQNHKYAEAIRDCLKSIEIDPSYSKAYSRLGLAYYAQGNYKGAIEKGFKKALELDPNNESVKENILVAEEKLKQEQQRTERNTNTGSSSREFSWSYGIPPFGSMSFDLNSIPVDIASMTSAMAGHASSNRGEHSEESQGETRNANQSSEPEIGLGGDINLNLGENLPEDLRGALRSVMEMFSGAASGNPQNTSNGRSPTN